VLVGITFIVNAIVVVVVFFLKNTHLYIYNVLYIKRPRDLTLNSEHCLNYSAGFVLIKLIPEHQVIHICISKNEVYLMEDFLNVSIKI
jgi:hypothetical protein